MSVVELPPVDVVAEPKPELKIRLPNPKPKVTIAPSHEKEDKPKRKLSEAQIAAFAKGREALKQYHESRRLQKQALIDEANKNREEQIAKAVADVKAKYPNAEIKVAKRRGPVPGSKHKPVSLKPPAVRGKGRPRKVEETSATSDQAYSESESESESDSGSESEGTRKYVRKTERRLRTVKKIEEKLKHHANPYFRNGMSVF